MNWPWQPRSVAAIEDAWTQGYRVVCAALPTGMGKTRTAFDLARPYIDMRKRVVFMTNRRMLTEQTGASADDQGIDFSFLASQFEREGGSGFFKIVSAQTARARDYLPPADVVIVDEAHRHDFDFAVDYYKQETNAKILQLTATPIGLMHCDYLIVGGTKHEGRAHKALVPCKVFAPSEPDIRGVRTETRDLQPGASVVDRGKGYEFVPLWNVPDDSAARDAVRVKLRIVFGNLLEWFQKIQAMHAHDFPSGMPALLWAPGVSESRWIAEAFTESGISAAHIDGDTDAQERDRIRFGSKTGKIRVVCSMGVMREGIDWPWVTHGILVQACESIQTYLQLVGRLLRASANKPYAVFQDHSGAWHRHGSPNADIEWELGDGEADVIKKLAAPKPTNASDAPEGIVCPKCTGIRKAGPKCPHCGHEHTNSVRRIFSENGELQEVEGSPNWKEPPAPKEAFKVWMGCLFACGRSGRTMGQAVGMYFSETGASLPRDFKFYPNDFNWARRVKDVLPWTCKARSKA